jgi:tetratricopeptide (TPR) repeat protein
MWYQRAAVFAAVPPVIFPLWDNPLVGADFWTARLTAIKVIARYLAILVWPAHLSCDYSYAQIPLFGGSPSDWLSCIVAALAAAFVAVMFRRNRTVFFVACAGFLALLPASNLLVPVGTVMAERLLYIPSVAFAFCVVTAAYAGARRAGAARLAPLVLCLIVAAFAVRTWTRNADWQTDLTLASATVRESPASYKAHMMMAGALYDSDPEHGNMHRVIDEAEKSLAILDGIPDARNNPGSYRLTAGYYFAQGDLLRKRGPDGGMIAPPDALQAYRRSVELALRSRSIVRASKARSADPAPDLREADLDRTISAGWLRLMSPDKAREAALAAVRIEPFNADSYGQLAAALSAEGRADDAAVALMEGVLLTSDLNLRQGVLALYAQGLDTDGCATIPGRGGVPALNPSCGIVRTHLCAAAIASIRLGLETGRRDISEQVKASALRDFGCPAASLDAALAP